MAKSKLIPQAAPTFKATAQLPVPGQKESFPVEFTFRHRTKSELIKWRESLDLASHQGITADHVAEMATGWDLEDAFDAENIDRLLETLPGAGVAIFLRYNSELQDAKQKN